MDRVSQIFENIMNECEKGNVYETGLVLPDEGYFINQQLWVVQDIKDNIK